jgi:lysophospholipase L1-like esterase
VREPGSPREGALQPSAAQSFGAQSFGAQTFVALGDSFSEGVGDPAADGIGWRGWADRAAERLAVHWPGLRYANLAIRGNIVSQVNTEQVPVAAGLRPDLVSIAVGGNDLLRPRSDPDALAELFSGAVAQLTATGSRVMIFTGFDPGLFPFIRMIRGKVAVYNAHLRAIARRHDCLLVDLWSMRVLADRRMWSADRLHLGPEGHRRVSLRACEVIGVPVDADWREPLPSAPLPLPAYRGAPAWLAARRQDAHWARSYAAPWLHRRLTGVSSGDGIPPKRPDLLPLLP